MLPLVAHFFYYVLYIGWRSFFPVVALDTLLGYHSFAVYIPVKPGRAVDLSGYEQPIRFALYQIPGMYLRNA